MPALVRPRCPLLLLALSVAVPVLPALLVSSGCRDRPATSDRLAKIATVDAAADAIPGPPLRLAEYAPRSMLHAAAHQVPRARFPVIDFHQHTNDHLLPAGAPG